MIKILLDYKWCFIWAIIVIILCTLPGNNFDGVPAYPGMDKLVHCGMFFVFCTLMYNGVIQQFSGKPTKWIPIFVVTIMGFLFAGLTELLQLYIFTYRSGDWWDLFADSVGIGMAGFAYLLNYVNNRRY
ncbi:VanZ family protein [Sphingobacterium sp. N143]|uniref:VanZ family protein n=1 Tax=Sphingobacterium sp. N143 TaxID=2746727 RepID=UPI002574CD12|nr:VanZ family protein [Sphingobacterium sp. N143]